MNYPDDVLLDDVYFADENNGWIAGGADSMSGGAILHTADGGKHWTVQVGDFKSEGRAYGYLRFLDAHAGWAVQATGMAAKLLHTTDGENWTEIGTIPEHFKGLEFTSPTEGVVVNGRRILRTSDAGRTWNQVFDCTPKVQVNGLTQQVECQFQSLHFANAQVGYAIGRSPQMNGGGVFVAKTEDSGNTWNVALAIPNAKADDGAVHFVDADHGVVLAWDGSLWYTSDGGKTFNGLPGASIHGKPQFRFAGPVGWAFGYSTLAYTTNGGRRWTTRDIPFPATVYAWTLVRGDYGYVVGKHGMIYRYHIVPITYSVPHMLPAPSM